MPDGSIPSVVFERWARWVGDCVSLLDGDGAYRHWKYEGAYADQPWIDLQVYNVIRQKWVALKNKEMDNKFNKMKTSLSGKSRGKTPRFKRRRR